MKLLNTYLISTSLAIFALAGIAQAEKWDMPMAYSATNFHSEHGVIFADKVKQYSNGKLEITVHPGGSLFKGEKLSVLFRLVKPQLVKGLCQPMLMKHLF